MGELASNAQLRAWIDAVAPGVRQRMHVEPAFGPRVRAPDNHQEDVVDDTSEELREMRAQAAGSHN